MAGKLKGKKNSKSASHTYMNPSNLRKGYTNTKKTPKKKVVKPAAKHKPFVRNGNKITLFKKQSTNI